ncbi:hypothetical protein THIOM_001107 [Candidatus Thiomargarita nelsonii]|uniref:Uncharacterized protein n=1 Tax=Candidatus Thiomargarita nelsonii TaxID=1003181 RepID=A0A176S531_9GAMM|nr:hypothetical protein THIOM_001107 [Candidatus Thiomargarita nelsonii]
MKPNYFQPVILRIFKMMRLSKTGTWLVSLMLNPILNKLSSFMGMILIEQSTQNLAGNLG